MSIWNELILPKINKISNEFVNNFNDDLKMALEALDKLEEGLLNDRAKARDKTGKGKDKNTTILQSIDEDEAEPTKPKEPQDTKLKRKPSNKPTSDIFTADSTTASISSSDNDRTQRSKKRSKNEVDGLLSPEQEKRQKRNASVKAQTIISKQVNVNLTQKLRRENSTEKNQRSRRRNDDDKENDPVPVIQIKQEKISLPTEPMEIESLPDNNEIKSEPVTDDIAMPPPAMPPPTMPAPRTRRNVPKNNYDETDEEASCPDKRRTRTRKQTDSAPAPAPVPVPRGRSTRSTRNTDVEEQPAPIEVRPKRTRAKKKVSEVTTSEVEKDVSQPAPPAPQDNGPASPAENPRPKRTRRGQKAAEKLQEPEVPPQEPTVQEPPVEVSIQKLTKEVPPLEEPSISPKEEKISLPDISSPIIPQKKIKKPKKKEVVEPVAIVPVVEPKPVELVAPVAETNCEITNRMDQTVVLSNGVSTPKNTRNMNETVVLEKTELLGTNMDATVVIPRLPLELQLTEDNSIMTNDSDSPGPHTPPLLHMPQQQQKPTSAVKEKVQQFEELASRVTRTKTRALEKKEEDPVENATPTDKVSKPILSVETLNKMNNMIFNGKTQISTSASKPRINVVPMKSMISSSTSKVSTLYKAKEAAEESLKREKEDARKKKEAILEAKRELQKRKREEKMAAAAAAREAAERDRRAALEAAARERDHKQAHAHAGKVERIKEVERKKQELARKVAETEERRRMEELARHQRLAEEQRRAEANRRKQIEEQDNLRKEEVRLAKEIEKKQKEYNEKQKNKYRLEEKGVTPLKGVHVKLDPVYMVDGFQYLNSDEEADHAEGPVPSWSTSRACRQQLAVQCLVGAVHVDRLFSVRVHSPDLRDIFPDIARHRLKRTSSAVWRTSPRSALPAVTE